MLMKSDQKKFLCAEKIKLDPCLISLSRFQKVTEVDRQRDGCLCVGKWLSGVALVDKCLQEQNKKQTKTH